MPMKMESWTASILPTTTFVNTMTQEPTVEQLVPIAGESEEELKHHWDYIYEPDSKEVLDALLTRYIESLAYQACS